MATSMVGYIDPGSGSVIAQAVVAGSAGVAVVARMYRSRLKRALGLGRDEGAEPSPADTAGAGEAPLAAEPDGTAVVGGDEARAEP